MTELRSVLERVAERVTPSQDAFDRLERRHRRKQRHRRIATAVVALLVAFTGSLAAFIGFRGVDSRTPLGAPEEFLALWPELTLADVEAAQALADAGDANLQWRLDPDQTAAHFAQEVLGWPVEGGLAFGELVEGPDRLIVDVGLPPPTCPTPGWPPCLSERTVRLVEERLVRAGERGIWSVIGVRSDGVDLPVQPGQVLTTRSSLHAAAPFGDELLAIAGYHFFGAGDCDVANYATSGRIDSGDVTLSMPETMPDGLPPDCGDAVQGYVFAYSAPAFHVQNADPFLSRRPYPILALAAVPVTIERAPLPPQAAASTPVAPPIPPPTASTPVAPPIPPPTETPYPRGAFDWCPSLEGTQAAGPNAAQEASGVALQFARASLAGDEAAVAELEDPSVPKDAFLEAGTNDRVAVLGAHDDPGGMVGYGCGPEVAARTITVAMDDGTNSSSADFYLYLVRRADGWKVWASY